MILKKTQIAIATTMALGLATVSSSVSADAIATGSYTMEIQITPEEYPGTGIPDVGDDGTGAGAGNRESSFTFNALPSFASQLMSDNGVLLADGFGSSVGSDGVAGKIGLTSDGTNLTFTSFNVDTIFGTAGGNFAQEGNTSTWTGTTGATTTFDPTGREGGIDGTGIFTGNPWSYKAFSDQSSTNANGTVNGTSVTAVADRNGDGIADYDAVFVSAGQVGPEWGTFNGAQYIEVWKVEINSVPVPAAVWLFGSGLVGLVGVARRRKNAA